MPVNALRITSAASWASGSAPTRSTSRWKACSFASFSSPLVKKGMRATLRHGLPLRWVFTDRVIGGRGICAATLVAVLAGAGSADAKPSAPVLSSDILVKRMVDPAAALKPLPPGVRVVMPSSHDRNGGNQDGGESNGPLAASGTLPPPYVRKEDGGYVLMEFHQPGCLVRTYMSGGPAPPGDTRDFGRLQLFVDGEAKPRFDENVNDLFGNRDARYPRPLVGDYLTSSGGNFAMVPFCFARSLKVRTTSLPFDALSYWQANVLLAPRGTRVTPYDPAVDLRDAAAKLAARPGGRAAAPGSRRQVRLDAGQTATVANLRGPGTIGRLDFSVAPFDLATLRSLSLRVTFDGAGKPQIDVPLASAFGDGIELRAIRSAAFGMDPKAGTGYISLPMPFARSARVQLVAGRTVTATVSGTRGPKPPPGAGVLHIERHTAHAALGADTRVLDAPGSGRVAAIVMDDVDGGPVSGTSPLQRFLEGDERVAIDGSRSPVQYGTGHEEQFNGGYYYELGAYSGLFGGAGPLGTTGLGDGTQSQYRVFADDGMRWSNGIAYGEEHGGGDEQPDTVELTTFSYRAPATLRETGAADVAGDASLTAYFEGEHDGNGTNSTVIAGGTYYPAPDPADSPEGVTARGTTLTGPTDFTLRIDRHNSGVALRGLFDVAPPLQRAAGQRRRPPGRALGVADRGRQPGQALARGRLRPAAEADRRQAADTRDAGAGVAAEGGPLRAEGAVARRCQPVT